jgi:hypothetical protein
MKWPIFNKPPIIPDSDSPAAFGHKRSYYYHSGIDLYCEENQEIIAIESGKIVNIEIFTGPEADPPSPWWNQTYSIMVEGKSGVIGYCELKPMFYIYLGMEIEEGDLLGKIIPVLKRDKGNGTTMAHIELYKPGAKSHLTWNHGEEKPDQLLDPTKLLINISLLDI